uniref:Uncharacterized protein n=1 Tax=Romanomermis culicivorax TaxID=13658 RepID=A0A915K0B5_ROMCU
MANVHFYALFLVLVLSLRLSVSSKPHLGSKLFSSKCESNQYTEWTNCLWPHGDLRLAINNFLNSAKEKSCKVPNPAMLNSAFSTLQKGTYKEHPLYSRIPDQPCGFCGRKVKCCSKNVKNFLKQSYKSDACDQTLSFCTLPRMSDDYVAGLASKYANVSFNGNHCDYDQYTRNEFESFKSMPAYNFIKPLICQIYSSTKPKINCVEVGNECRCCCLHYKYINGQCVPDESMRSSDQSCA